MCSVFESKILHRDLLELVVRGDLSCVNHRVTQDIGTPSCPKSSDTVFSYGMLVTVDGTLVDALIRRQLSLSLHADFYQISWVCYCDSNGSRCHTRHDLLQQSRVLTLF